MDNPLSRLTLNQKLAVAALALGAVAVAAVPSPGGKVTLDARELALTVSRDADRISAADLAAWIIERRADYRLIDLRGDADFARYHIPTATNVPVARLVDAGLGRQEKLVLYADGGMRAAQAWLLLKASGYKGVYMLKGDLPAWKNEVMFPVLADDPSAGERARDETRRSVSAFFGGQPRRASAVAQAGGLAPDLAMPAGPAAPRVVAPASPTGGAKAGPARKKEGC